MSDLNIFSSKLSISGCLKTIHLRFLHALLKRDAKPNPNNIEINTLITNLEHQYIADENANNGLFDTIKYSYNGTVNNVELYTDSDGYAMKFKDTNSHMKFDTTTSFITNQQNMNSN